MQVPARIPQFGTALLRYPKLFGRQARNRFWRFAVFRQLSAPDLVHDDLRRKPLS